MYRVKLHDLNKLFIASEKSSFSSKNDTAVAGIYMWVNIYFKSRIEDAE